jgi:hypothetical protein
MIDQLLSARHWRRADSLTCGHYNSLDGSLNLPVNLRVKTLLGDRRFLQPPN